MKAKRETVYESLSVLEKNGRLTPEQVVEAATDKKHPLHGEFEWNNKKAGHLYRMEQARTLIRSVRLVRGEGASVVREIAYVRDQSKGNRDQGYISVPRLRNEKENARESVLYEFTRACSALARAREVAFCLGLQDEIERLCRSVDDVRKQVA